MLISEERFLSGYYRALCHRAVVSTFCGVMAASLALAPLPVWSQQYDSKSETVMEAPVTVPGGTKVISLDADSENVRDVLRTLSQKGGFNLVMDDSVSGSLTLSLTKVSINQALKSICELNDFEIVHKTGNIFLIVAHKVAIEKGLTRGYTKMVKIRYGNAQRISDILNNSIFADENVGQATSNGQQRVRKARPDFRTNSVLIVGTKREVELAENLVQRLDKPRQSKTFFLTFADSVDVSTQLASSVFNDGTNQLILQEGGGSGVGLAGRIQQQGGQAGLSQFPSLPASLRVQQENIREGQGINDFANGNSSGSGTSGSSSSSGPLSQTVTLRGVVKTSQTLSLAQEGALIVPDTRTNSVTVMGTTEQIALAEQMISIFDAQIPQVAIEASLVEISDTGIKELGTRFGGRDTEGKINLGFNNLSSSGVGIPTVSSTGNAQSGIGFTTNPLNTNTDYIFEVRNLINNRKAKVLSNPTVVATHDTEAIISVVDEVVRRVNVTVNGQAGVTQVQQEIGEAGIVLDILPRIGQDGTITMRIRPSVTSVRDTVTDANGNIVTLLNKRDLLAQSVRVKDGQSLVLAGLVQQSDVNEVDKVPALADLPVVGAIFRASQRNGKRTELVMMITPHLINRFQFNPPTFTSTAQ